VFGNASGLSPRAACLAAVVAVTAAAALSQRGAPDRPESTEESPSAFVAAGVAPHGSPPHAAATHRASTGADQILLRDAARYRPRSTGSVAEQVRADVAAARREREPRYLGRAEAQLDRALRATPDDPTLHLLKAQLLQHRHAFDEARGWLDRVLQHQPRDRQARLIRAQIALVQGEFAKARPDCAFVMALGETMAGSVCLAQVLAGQGDLPAAQRLTAQAVTSSAEPGAMRAWALGVSADLASRAGALADARTALDAAVDADADDELVRLARVDLAVADGDVGRASALLDLPRPSPGVLWRRALHAKTPPEREGARRAFTDAVRLGLQRGDPRHWREEAQFALWVQDDAPRALTLAQRNFAEQRETVDVRLLVTAAVRADSAEGRAALHRMRTWMQTTGYVDVEVDRVLKAAPR
jgi:Tfp pilus assembly protein PilF